jgi:hypothetical protein
VRVLICGDRNWRWRGIITSLLDGLCQHSARSGASLTVVEGCAKGADKAACEWEGPVAWSHHAHFPADWDQYGKRAGPLRNQAMLDSGVDLVVAFHDDLENSKGTKHMVSIATKAGVPTYHVRRVN